MTLVPLFAGDRLDDALAARVKAMSDRLAFWDHDLLLNAAESDVAEQLLDMVIVECPVLLSEKAEMLLPQEVILRLTRSFGDPIDRRVMQHTLVVPFTGEPDVFRLRANKFASSRPHVSALKPGELHLVAVDVTVPQHAWAGFNNALDEIEKWIGWSREQINAHNSTVTAAVPRQVSDRRAQLLAARQLQASIGFPIRRRPDADTYAVPIKRRKLRPERSTPIGAAGRFHPEPTMVVTDYNAALTTLRHARNALERSPSTVARFTEEQIRDVLLINLNTIFEGDAAGEVFNGDGKTDILIRVEDRNIFIGECKVWNGTDSMTEALAQIFRYLVWRDTKAAILLFIRNVNVTAVIEQAVRLIEAHPNYKRTIPTTDEDRYDFVMHATGDPQREINLAFMPFALRTRTTGRGGGPV